MYKKFTILSLSMNILVTGGAGFIGSHLVDKLIEKGMNVIIIDNLSNGRKENINKKAIFVRMEIQSHDVEKVFKQYNPQVLFHLAAQINLRRSIENPFIDIDTNIIGSVNIFECCRKYNVEKIVFSSSAAVYGEPRYLPVDENHPLMPESPYGIDKLTVEKFLFYYWKTYGIDYTILRYANVYGPRQNPKGEAGVIPIFISKMLNRERPVIFGDGNQTRDFIYVSDVVEATALCMEKKTRNKVFNIGSGNEISVNDLFHVIKEILNISLEPIYEEPKKEVRRFVMSIERAKEELGWRPRVTLREGIRSTIEFLKNVL